MFIKAAGLSAPNFCRIIGYGHTELDDDIRFRAVTPEAFIRDMMSMDGSRNLFGYEPPWPAEDIAATAEKWIAQTGIKERIFFAGSTAELGAIVAKKCLQHAGVRPEELVAIVGGPN